jgi:hypothetical protein
MDVGEGAHGSIMDKALCYKPEGLGSETRGGKRIVFNFPNPSGRTTPWALLSLQHKLIPEAENNVCGE